MCQTCNEPQKHKKIQYMCDCQNKACTCDSVIEFDTDPHATPYCCGAPMKRKR
ncbi:MAG: hypothetical protein QXL17_05385 [Candidatus Thermoplasmatota archaeon]